MNTLSEEQKGFVVESLKSGMGIGHIVDDLIEIYGIVVDDSDREKLYRRVQKVKSKLTLPAASETASEAVSDKDKEIDILSSVSPQWRLSYLRALLREAGGDVSLKTRILREIRVEEQLICEKRVNAAIDDHPLIEAIYMRTLRQHALDIAIHKVEADKAFSVLMGNERAKIDQAVGFMLGDPTRFMTKSEADSYEFFELYQRLVESGDIYPETIFLVKAYYTEIEAGAVYERKCDGVRVDSTGTPLTPGEKSDAQWREERDEQERRDYFLELSEMDPEKLKEYLYEVDKDMDDERYQAFLDEMAKVLSHISAENEA